MKPDAVIYSPLTPSEAAAELGVSLTQRLQPNLRDQVPKRFVSKAEAEARGWSWYFDGSSICRCGHNAAHRTANPNICSDCDRVAAEEAPVYGKSKTQKYYEPRRPSNDSVPVQAPTAPAQIEPTKKEQEFLAALDALRDFDTAAAQAGFTRSQIEARASVNEVFRKALQDLTDRRGIAWTRAPDAETFKWSPEIRHQFARRYVDVGLLEQVRQEMAISASEYHAHLAASPAFAALIVAAEPLARITLKDLATKAASAGNDRLLKLLQDSEPQSVSTMSTAQLDNELNRLIGQLESKGLLPDQMRHRVTGQLIDFQDLEYALPDSNSDLVGGL